MKELLIQNGSTIYAPAVKEGITWSTERKSVPGKLEFTALRDDILQFTEGNAVRFKVDDKPVFYGFVFQKGRDKSAEIKVTAYDQLRYFKNKETYSYTNKTADQLIRMIAGDFNLNIGELDDTEYSMSRVEDNQTLFDIIQNALDYTTQYRGNIFVLYDDFGKLTLRNIENMKLDLLIDAETGENYDYTSSIDGETYNRIKLSYDNSDTGKRDIYIAQDSAHINEWGLLQYTDTVDETVTGQLKANALLALYNKKTRNLSLKNLFGDIRVRAGSLIAVKMDFDDISLSNYMLVEKAQHTFNGTHHTMDLTLSGKNFSA